MLWEDEAEESVGEENNKEASYQPSTARGLLVNTMFYHVLDVRDT